MAIIRINTEGSNIKEEEQRLNDILSSINSHNQGFTDDQNRKIREAELKKEAEEREERNRILQEQFRLRHEKEAENKRLRENEEYQAMLALQKKQERNPFNNLIKKVRAEKKELEENDATKDNVCSLFVANILERVGDLYIKVREWFIMKKRIIANRVIRLLAKTIGFTVPELPEDIDAEEERIRIKKEEKKAKKSENKAAKAKKKKETSSQESSQTAEESSDTASARKSKKSKKSKETKEDAVFAPIQPEPVSTNPAPDPTESVPATATPQPPAPEQKPAFNMSELSDDDWNDHLDEEFRELKEDIIYAHSMPSFRSTERAITDIQNEENILAVLMSSKDMNDLFIFSDKDMFIDLITDKLNFSVDYTYIYVITPTAAMYYGSDTCYHKLTVVFDNIRMLILRGRKFFDEKALKNIEGINMFRNIYIS